MSVNVTSNSPQDYTHPDDRNLCTSEGFFILSTGEFSQILFVFMMLLMLLSLECNVLKTMRIGFELND